MLRILVATLLLAMIPPAIARDNGQYAQKSPEMRDWVRGLKDKRGVGCCDTADGYPAEAEWDTDSKGYRVRIDGKWYAVPDETVITEPNRFGYAVVWYWFNGGVPMIRCFLPGGGA